MKFKHHLTRSEDQRAKRFTAWHTKQRGIPSLVPLFHVRALVDHRCYFSCHVQQVLQEVHYYMTSSLYFVSNTN